MYKTATLNSLQTIGLATKLRTEEQTAAFHPLGVEHVACKCYFSAAVSNPNAS